MEAVVSCVRRAALLWAIVKWLAEFSALMMLAWAVFYAWMYAYIRNSIATNIAAKSVVGVWIGTSFGFGETSSAGGVPGRWGMVG